MKKKIQYRYVDNQQSRRKFIRTSTLAGSLALMPWVLSGRKNSDTSSLLSYFKGENNTEDQLSDMGLLDVTNAPYLADPSGRRDSTQSIQQAVNDARDKGMVCFFPEGTYIISDMISCEQRVEKLGQPRKTDGRTQTYWDVQRPMVLMGSNRGKRPVIKLAKDARGFDDQDNPKKAIWIWAQTRDNAPGKDEPEWGKEQGNISFSHFFMNIDIDVSGHAGAIGLRHNGSQGSALLNTKIYAEGAYSGMTNCCGQGGGTYNVEIVGGDHGIVIDSGCRFPILTSCTFTGQKKAAISYAGPSIQVPTMLVGCMFKPSGNTAVDMSTANSYGGLIMIDCMFDMSKGSTIVATRKQENIFIENSYARGAETVFTNGLKTAAASSWVVIEQFSSSTDQGMNLINGKESEEMVFKVKPAARVAEYSEFHQRHFREVPFFDDPDTVNVLTYGAKGDGKTDDTEAFRKAIAAGKKIFVHKGNFKLTGKLTLGPETTLFGLTRSFTSIGPGGMGRRTGGEGAMPQENNAESFTLSTVDDVNASPGLFLISVRGNIEWKSGKGVWLMTSGAPSFSGNGGGRFYGYGSIFRQFIIEGIRQPTSFYSFNVERVRENPQSEIRNCSHVRIYYFKVEAGTVQSGNNADLSDANTPGKISGSEDITIYCMYGNVKKLQDKPMLEIVDSRKVKVCQLKAFQPGEFPHIRETNDGKTCEIPSGKIASLFIRD